ncbi:MAG: hypothetical protein HQ464_11990, partial [Planctomycetes bacterium]|nr:hypothetical protein [Planctomycetota bacterium]
MIQIETPALRAVFDPDRNALRQLTDLERGHDYLGTTPAVPLVEMEVVVSDRRGACLTPAGPASVVRQGPRAVALRWDTVAGDGLELPIACELDAHADGAEIV